MPATVNKPTKANVEDDRFVRDAPVIASRDERLAAAKALCVGRSARYRGDINATDTECPIAIAIAHSGPITTAANAERGRDNSVSLR